MLSVGDYPFKGLDRDKQPVFGCYHIRDMDGSTYPHVKAVMYNNLVPKDNTLLLGEILPILRIMIAQFWKAWFVHHMVSPVITSSSGLKRVRVIALNCVCRS